MPTNKIAEYEFDLEPYEKREDEDKNLFNIFKTKVKESKEELVAMLQQPIVSIYLGIKPEDAGNYIDELVKDYELYHLQLRWFLFAIEQISNKKTCSLEGGTGSGKSFFQLFEAMHLNVLYPNKSVYMLYTSPTSITDALKSNAATMVREARKFIRKVDEPVYKKEDLDYKYGKLLADKKYAVAIHHEIVKSFDKETKDAFDYLCNVGKFIEITNFKSSKKEHAFRKFLENHSKMVFFASVHYFRPGRQVINNVTKYEDTKLTSIIKEFVKYHKIDVRKISFDEVHAYYHSSDGKNMPHQTSMTEKQFNPSTQKLFDDLYKYNFIRVGYSGTLSKEQEEDMALKQATGIINFTHCTQNELDKTMIGLNNASVDSVIDISKLSCRLEFENKGYIELNYKFRDKIYSKKIFDYEEAMFELLFATNKQSEQVDFLSVPGSIVLNEKNKVVHRELKPELIESLKFVHDEIVYKKKEITFVKVDNDGSFLGLTFKELEDFYKNHYNAPLDSIMVSSSKDSRLISSDDKEQFKNPILENILDLYPQIKVVLVNKKHGTGFSYSGISSTLYLTRITTEDGNHNNHEQNICRTTREGEDNTDIAFLSIGNSEQELLESILGKRRTIMTTKTKAHYKTFLNEEVLNDGNSTLDEEIAKTISGEFNKILNIPGGMKTNIDHFIRGKKMFIESAGLNYGEKIKYIEKSMSALSQILSNTFEAGLPFISPLITEAGGLCDSDAIINCKGNNIKLDAKVTSLFVENLDEYLKNEDKNSKVGLKGADRTTGWLKKSNLFVIAQVIMDANFNYIFRPAVTEFEDSKIRSISTKKLYNHNTFALEA